MDELSGELDERLARFVLGPWVTVVVTQVNSYKIYVIGTVNKPEQCQIGQQPDVMPALCIGSGLTPFAREGSIQVLRSMQGETNYPCVS